MPRFDPARRRLLTATPPGIPPPWADAQKLHELCTACGACAAACPTGILRTAGRPPVVDFARGECTFCGACADACPEPIFDRTREPPWALVARIGEACLALRQVYCQSCRDACPEAAIRFTPTWRAAPRPSVDAEACTGCGACVAACPVGAIEVGAVREGVPGDG
jgi:ferredoxin-type protein NapF